MFWVYLHLRRRNQMIIWWLTDFTGFSKMYSVKSAIVPVRFLKCRFLWHLTAAISLQNAVCWRLLWLSPLMDQSALQETSCSPHYEPIEWSNCNSNLHEPKQATFLFLRITLIAFPCFSRWFRLIYWLNLYDSCVIGEVTDGIWPNKSKSMLYK